MSTSSIVRPLKRCVFEGCQLIREQRFSSEEEARANTDEQILIINELLKPDEEKVVTWTGFALYRELDELLYYHCASFVLTDKRLYVVGGTQEEKYITIFDMDMCTNFGIFNHEEQEFAECVICFANAVGFMYEKGDRAVEWELRKELRRRGVHED